MPKTIYKFIVFLACICVCFCKFNVGHRRQKRYLVYPDGAPARAQFIIGLGIPVDIKEQAVTVGAVIKFQYDLPTNSSEYTTRIYGFANTVSRGMDEDVKDLERSNSTEEYEGSAEDQDEIEEDIQDDVTDSNLEDTTTQASNHTNTRKRRNVIYTEGGKVVDVIRSNERNNKLTLDEAIRRQEMIDAEIEEEEEPRRANRWDYYKMLEQTVERYGFSGRPCLLRTICEAAEVPFTHHSGLLAEIGHVLFTPSTTKDELNHHTDNEFHAAEKLGKEEGVNCEVLFPDCETSILDTFTQIGMNTLHKFGGY